MNRLSKRTVWALRIVALAMAVVVLTVSVPWDAAWAYFAPLPPTVKQEVDRAPGLGFDGIVVYVDSKGEKPAFYTAGWKDRAAKIPADPHALFKIASISKLYIAAATTKLVAAGRLSLDDSLAHLVPEVAGRIDHADAITLRMLLQHRSGIPNFTDDPKHDWVHPGDSDAMLALIIDDPADFKPGVHQRYSNSNYLLIARILDRTLGYSHRDYIRAELLAPLGLKNTYGQMSEAPKDRIMSGYVAGYPDDAKPIDYALPGGSMIATAEDVGIFLRALNDGSLLSVEEQAIYTSVYQFDHSGMVLGYQSVARYHKDSDTVVVQFTSTSGKNSWLKSEAIYRRIVRLVRKRRT